jgi:photosystem II stability/assembly factor-like uncharacterized protein
VWVAGDDGVVLRGGNSAWARAQALTSVHLRGVWAYGDSSAVVVGDFGRALFYDGASGREEITPGLHALEAVWSGADGHFVAVGADGVVLLRDESGWRIQETPTRHDLFDVWGSSPDDIFAVGSGGTILRYR